MLTEAELRTLLVVAIGAAIVLAGEVIAVGAALGGCRSGVYAIRHR